MKLAFCLFHYFPHGGLQRDFFRIVKECVNRGHDVTIYTSKWQGESINKTVVQFITPTGFSNHAQTLSFAKQLQPLCMKGNFDAVIGFNKIPEIDFYFAGDACLKTKLAREKKLFLSWLPRYKQYLKLEDSVFSSNTQILHLTEYQKAEYQYAYSTPSEQFHFIPAGISQNHYSMKEMDQVHHRIRQKLGKQNHALILFIASQFYNKGLDRALRALSSLKKEKACLVVIGEGGIESYKGKAKKLDLLDNTLFLGARENVLDYMIASDLLIHPARTEAAGMVLIEALTAGLPVLSTQNCGYAFHIQHARAGIILPNPFSQANLDKTLSEMITHEKREQWKRNALNYAKTTDLYNMANKAVDLIENYIK